MRKYFLVMLALCLSLSIVGCSSSNEAENQEKSMHFELLPEDADLSYAPNVVVEPQEAPYNLGGWTVDNIVSWEVELPEYGQYFFNITYSRPGQYPTARGILRIETEDGEIHDLNFKAYPTGENKNEDDWTVYITKDAIGDNLVAGTALISVIPNYEPDDNMPEHFINLRSIEVIGEPNSYDSTPTEPENEQVALEDKYKIIIDGENATKQMILVMKDNVLYAEASSYFDVLTCNNNPILYSEYNQGTETIDVYSWDTDVMIIRFVINSNMGYRLTDVMNDEWNEITLDAEVNMDSENNVLVPVKAMTECLMSLGDLDADVNE